MFGMEAKSICGGLFTIILLMSIIADINAMKIGFGEIDYRAYEHKEGINITVQFMGMNQGGIPITVQTLTYEQVEETDWPIVREGLPDPAEYEIEGRQDFVNETFTYIIENSPISIKEVNVFVRFNDDEVDEKQEGFFVQVKVDESQLHPKDRDSIEYTRHGVALIRIEDNDEIKLSFSEPSYIVAEDAGVQTNLIAVVKEDNRTTEKTLEVMIQVLPYTDAKRGEDYTIMNQTSSLVLTFTPEEQIKYIPFEVINDTIAETRESFSIYLTVPANPEVYYLGTIHNTIIYIVDDEEAIVGFESLTYNVNEGQNAKVEVCVKVYDPAEIDFYITGFLMTESGTATDDTDYYPLVQTPIDFTHRGCENIYIKADQIIEDVETFRVRFELDPFNPPNVAIGQELDVTEVSITDQCFQCGPHAECIESEGNMMCACKTGFTGNGITCTDVNECARNTDNCNAFAWCTNTQGSFQCSCKNGFFGNGVQCSDINECLRRNKCHRNAVCHNRPGSYYCRCKYGYIGNGVFCRSLINKEPPTQNYPNDKTKTPKERTPKERTSKERTPKERTPKERTRTKSRGKTRSRSNNTRGKSGRRG